MNKKVKKIVIGFVLGWVALFLMMFFLFSYLTRKSLDKIAYIYILKSEEMRNELGDIVNIEQNLFSSEQTGDIQKVRYSVYTSDDKEYKVILSVKVIEGKRTVIEHEISDMPANDSTPTINATLLPTPMATPDVTEK